MLASHGDHVLPADSQQVLCDSGTFYEEQGWSVAEWAHFALGRVHLLQGQYEIAIVELEKALDLYEPSDVKVV